jgi:hypothetical protein
VSVAGLNLKPKNYFEKKIFSQYLTVSKILSRKLGRGREERGERREERGERREERGERREERLLANKKRHVLE